MIFINRPAYKPIVFIACLLPLVWLCIGISQDSLGANPSETIIRSLGIWSLRILLLTLAITPIRTWTKWHELARLRRMLGLFSFFYVSLHFLAYAWLYKSWYWSDIVTDSLKRPFIFLGILGLLLMIPLALTSTNRMIKLLGPKLWKNIHKLIYLIGIIAILHFIWLRSAKMRYDEPMLYIVILFLLLIARYKKKSY